jgi:hypothetical protein
VATVDFDSEPAYWYESTVRSARAAGLPVRHRPAVNRDERLMAQEVARHLERVVIAQTAAPAVHPAPHARICAQCGQRFSRRAWGDKRLWRVIYPPASRGGGRVELYRHLICP